MARYLYSELSSLIQARANVDKDLATLTTPSSIPPTPNTLDAIQRKQDWLYKHVDMADELCKNHMPHGSGFDAGTQLDWDASHAEKLVFTTAYHHMNDNGYYDGWTEHLVTVTPSLAHGFHMRISGRNRNDIKDYIGDEFQHALGRNVEWDIVRNGHDGV